MQHFKVVSGCVVALVLSVSCDCIICVMFCFMTSHHVFPVSLFFDLLCLCVLDHVLSTWFTFYISSVFSIGISLHTFHQSALLARLAARANRFLSPPQLHLISFCSFGFHLGPLFTRVPVELLLCFFLPHRVSHLLLNSCTYASDPVWLYFTFNSSWQSKLHDSLWKIIIHAVQWNPVITHLVPHTWDVAKQTLTLL